MDKQELERCVLRRFARTLIPTLLALLIAPLVFFALAALWRALISAEAPFTGIWAGILTAVVALAVSSRAEARYHGYEALRRLYVLRQGVLSAPDQEEAHAQLAALCQD